MLRVKKVSRVNIVDVPINYIFLKVNKIQSKFSNLVVYKKGKGSVLGHFNPWIFTLELFNPDVSNPDFSTPWNLSFIYCLSIRSDVYIYWEYILNVSKSGLISENIFNLVPSSKNLNEINILHAWYPQKVTEIWK